MARERGIEVIQKLTSLEEGVRLVCGRNAEEERGDWNEESKMKEQRICDDLCKCGHERKYHAPGHHYKPCDKCPCEAFKEEEKKS